MSGQVKEVVVIGAGKFNIVRDRGRVVNALIVQVLWGCPLR